MKKTIVKKHDELIEKIEIIDEEKWVYVHYWRGDYEKKAMFLKSEEKSIEAHFQDFYNENAVTYEMIHETNKIIRKEKNELEYLLKASSLHLGLGIMFAIACIAGFKLGSKLDLVYGVYPVFTITGLFLAIGLGGLTGFIMIRKYLTPHK
jgi:hypothetical protein